MDGAGWDERYAAADLVWSATPNAVVARETADLPPGRALDLASGEGRNATWLAERGWRVTAVDFSAVATDRARRLAAERLGPEADRVEAVTADLMSWRAEPGAADLVVIAYLQLVPDERRVVLRLAADALAPGGTLLLVAHHSDNLTSGVGGPQDPTVLYTEADVVADLDGTGLVVDRAERVERVVGDDVALDVLVRAHRAHRREGPGMSSLPPAPPIRGVVFDFHHTLAHAGDPEVWLREAWTNLGREGDPATVLGDSYAKAAAFLDQLWEEARVVDPENERDRDPARHREVFDRVVATGPGLDDELADALYQIMHRQWDVYDDVLPVLNALKDKGIRMVMLSNVGFDLSPTLARTGVDELLDGAVMSYAVGAVKPDPAIFQNALDLLGLPASEVLMVGDAWQDDAAAAALGMRTLILPRTDDPSHGLELVVRLV